MLDDHDARAKYFRCGSQYAGRFHASTLYQIHFLLKVIYLMLVDLTEIESSLLPVTEPLVTA